MYFVLEGEQYLAQIENVVVGCFVREEDGHYVFRPLGNRGLSEAERQEISEKLDELNMRI